MQEPCLLVPMRLGQGTSFATAFIALIMASIMVTVGPIPFGLGSFDATSTAMLRLLGVPLEAAFAATLLLRLLTPWFPLLPGMEMLRRDAPPYNPRSAFGVHLGKQVP